MLIHETSICQSSGRPGTVWGNVSLKTTAIFAETFGAARGALMH